MNAQRREILRLADGDHAAAAARLTLVPVNRPCVERSETGACMACDARQGEPCQRPASSR